MKVKELDLKLIEKAKNDKILIGVLANDFGKSHYTIFRWLDGDYDNISPAVYEAIKKHFKIK